MNANHVILRIATKLVTTGWQLNGDDESNAYAKRNFALLINSIFNFAGAENSSRIFTAPAVSKNSVLDTILFADRIKTCQENL